MAETNSTVTENPTPAQAAPAGKSLIFKLAIVGVVVVVVGVECLVAYMLIPGSGEVAAASTAEHPAKPAAEESKHGAEKEKSAGHGASKHGEEKPAAKAEKGGEKGGEKHGAEKPAEKHNEKAAQKALDKALPRAPRPQDDAADLREVDLGEFTVTAAQPTSNSTLRISLHLYGTVSALDQDKFQARLKESQHRFREAVIVTVRGAEVTDLTDAGLGLLKRTILEKTNALLGEPMLKTVIFSEFSFYEI